MAVEIWPEYDDPRVLVIYEGRVTSSTTLPATISFVIPDGAQINMAGGIQDDGQHVHATYHTTAGTDGRSTITYALTVPEFHVEFYYDAFAGDNTRHFTYRALTPFAADTVTVRVQQPLRATDFRVSPASGRMTQDNDGFTYSVLQFLRVRADSETPISVSYQKTDRQPSVEPKASASTSGNAAPPWSRRRAAIYVLALVAVLSVGTGIFPAIRNRWQRRARTRMPARGDAPPAESAGVAASRYCTDCGAGLQRHDRYCGACGHAVRATPDRYARA